MSEEDPPSSVEVPENEAIIMTKVSSNKALVIVESPAKAKTINKYLGPGFEVKASMGHVRDLPSKGLSVDIENCFEPTYEILPGKKKTVASLKASVKQCDTLYLATDLDREGEAIAWHLMQILGVPEDKVYRVIFNAITKSAIQQAFAHPGRLDMDKVMAQQARRVLDRIVGYQISPLLWKKVTRGLSAGRVQSVAVKIIVEREREIRQFKPEEYWLIPAVFTTDLSTDLRTPWQDLTRVIDGKTEASSEQINRWLAEHKAFKAELVRVHDDKFRASNEQEARKVFDALSQASFSVAGLETKESVSQPSPPFITSTLQQTASTRLGFGAKRTMTVAQKLYEGKDLGSMGSLGLITYMRTDSTQVSPEALKEVRRHIQTRFGDSYLPQEPRFYTSSNKSAQEAHEAIHPTDVDMTPEDIRSFLSDDEYKLYDLIWRRFVASQMPPARWNVTTMDIQAPTALGTCWYKATGRIQVFDGYTQVWPVVSNEQPLPPVQPGQALAAVDVRSEQHFTKPPARYTEASLIKALEKEGIGRPSTYATIISTVQDRGYVEQLEKKFHATDLGEVVTDKLNEYFPTIMDIAFTRFMEEQLDKIAEQHLDWVGVLTEFYGPFKQSLEIAQQQMKHAKAEVTPSEYTCTQCGKPMVYRLGKNGRFLSCSGYPDCKFASPCDKAGKKVQDNVVTEHTCPICHKPMLLKRGRFGQFLGCSDYPQCKTTLKMDKQGNVLPPKPPPQPTGIKCYKCKDGELVIRQSKKGPFLGCGRFPKCRTIVSIKQIDLLKELQATGQWPPATREQADALLARKPKPTSTIDA
jgi:DNA topoisomerase I